MPVSVVCDAAAAASVVSAALRESIAGIGNSSNQINNCSAAVAGHKTTTKNDDNSDDDDDNGQNVQNKLIASTKRVLLTKIEYEEVNNYNQSVLDTLKSKYIILKPSSSSLSSSSTSPSPSSSHKNNNNNSTSGNNSTGKINHLNGGNGGETEEDNNDKGRNQNTASSQNTNSEQKQQQQLNGIKNDPNQLPQPKHVLYPREKVQIGWKNSSRKWQVGAGMTNVGNTCYLNSTLQALFHVPAMANWLMSDSQHREKCEDECVICAMSKTLIASQSSLSPIRPYLIYTKLKLICKHLILGRQEDAHEFLRYLVEAMEKSYLLRFRNWKELDQFSKETTPLNQILGGYLRSAVRCLACGHVSTTFQHFQDLLLDIRKANTIEEALDGYFSRERLEDMGYKCEACKKKVSATKQFSLERAPISLCIQLKRFSITGSKLLKPVTIRSRLDLRPYASKKSSTEHLTYRLVSMVTHLGISQNCGHYTAIGVTESGGYYQFDDSCVRSISLQNVMNTNTYIIFYELEDPQQHLTSSTSGGKLTSTQVSGEHNHQNSNNNNDNDNNLVPVENFYSRKMNSNNDKNLVPIDNFLNRKLNGLFNNNNNENNIFQKQNNSQSSSSSNANNSEMTKITNKSSDTKDKFSTITTTPMIGPQLPSDKSLLNGYKNSTLANSSGTQNSQNQNGGLTSTTATNLPYYKLVNSTSKLVKLSPNGSSTNNDDQISSKSKQSNQQQTTSNSKLAIHFKNTNSANSYYNNAKSQHEANSPSKSQLSDTNKTQTESTSKKSENVQAAKSVLPNMPKLESPTQRKTNSLLTSSPIVAKNSTNKSDVNNSKNSSTPDSSAASTRNDKARISTKSIPVKSLVPYETDDDESSKDEFDKEINKKKTVRSNGSSNSNRNIKCNYDSLDDSSLSSSSSEPEQNSTELLKSKTPPSPPVVKSKTGLWQVTSLNDTSSHTTTKSSTASSSSATPERKNPFATFPSIPSSNFYSSSSNKLNGNGNGNGKDKKSNGSNNKKYDGGYNAENHNGSNGNAVNQLLKLSHRGYGAPVLSWNGHKTEMEKEIIEETRLERKRELKDDEDTEMDRGKQKKMKMNNNKQSYNSRESSNPGYNPFQEYQGSQSQQQQQQRRWNNNNNNSSNNSSSNISNNNKNNSNSNSSNNSNGRYRNHNDGGILYNNNNRQSNNPFYRNNNNNHHHNNFRNRNHHHRFNNHHHHHHHQRSRNQRNGGGENRFHHRRDS